MASAPGSSANEQVAYLQQIELSFIDFWVHISELTSVEATQDEKAQEQAPSPMITYFNENSLDLLNSIIAYIRRELKVPQYSAFFEDDQFTESDFQKETAAILEESPALLDKLTKL